MNDDLRDDLHGVHSPEGWPPASEPSTAAAGETGPRTGFCQDCGKPLTAQTMRSVGTGVFCEPCLTARVAPAAAGPIPPPGVPGEPRPVLAALLGIIPGVGAMYNGQFAKGVAHLIVFTILISLSDHVSGVFGIFVAGWVFYQVFDAYHTAKARLDGLPLPNPFGFNDIGERMGFGKSWPNGAPNWSAAKPPAAGWQTSTPPVYGAGTVPPQGPIGSGADWVGYVPPTHFAGYGQPPYGAPYTAAPQPHTTVTSYAPVTPAGMPEWTPQPVAPVSTPANHLPVGALWLIALGGLILLANLQPNWRMSDRWFAPVLLAGIAVWLFLRRMRRGGRLIYALRAPVVLMLFAIHFALRAADIRVNFGMFIAVMLIALGALLLMERAWADRTYATGYPPSVAADSARASFIPATEYVAPSPETETPAAPHEGETR